MFFTTSAKIRWSAAAILCVGELEGRLSGLQLWQGLGMLAF
jgi:hypothetical protein